MSMKSPEVIVVGVGLAGLVTASELTRAGKRVLLLDQEPENSLGGQAHWSFGGVLMVGTPEQEALGIEDSHELALRDWLVTADFNQNDDLPRQWAERYISFAAGELGDWLREHGVQFVPTVTHPEAAPPGGGVGSSVPRFHVAWGMGPGLLRPFTERLRAASSDEPVDVRFRHRVDSLIVEDGRVRGVRGSVLAPDDVPRGRASNRTIVGEFEHRAGDVVIASGGFGGNLELTREVWPTERLGAVPRSLLRGAPEHVDGRMLTIASDAGAAVANLDRLWPYAEGVSHHTPLWSDHGVRLIAGPHGLWLDGRGDRLGDNLVSGRDSQAGLAAVRATGLDHSWLVITQRIAETSVVIAGQDQNPQFASVDAFAARPAVNPAVTALLTGGGDVLIADNVDELITKMQTIAPAVEGLRVRAAVRQWSAQPVEGNPTPDLLDPSAAPLVAIRLQTLTRKSLGGIVTDLRSRVLDASGQPIPGLYAVGEAAGFGGGGMHGHRALEGGFLGGCIFTGLTAARALIGTT
nr:MULTISPECIES: FAD-binding dehydrogenase [unclassified Cryobacterium]